MARALLGNESDPSLVMVMRRRPPFPTIVPLVAALLALGACERDPGDELPAPAATPPGPSTDLPTEDDMSPGADRLAPSLGEPEAGEAGERDAERAAEEDGDS
jgi:hypothetical protein